MSEELKPCPACQCRVVIAEKLAPRRFAVYCHGKDCEMGGPKRSTRSKAIAAWNSLPRAPHITPNDADCKGCPERRPGLAWTTEPPTVPGWYWWCFARDIVPRIVYVVWESTLRKTDNDHLLVLYPNRNEEFWVSERGGHWAGPIPGPEETS